ncbi:MAG: Mitochondrial Translation Optimization [Watsoniomyces obsoletus]|nr:MAG: Mitochondrial Translation Optimization [Watsoniomyces obsoletus]
MLAHSSRAVVGRIVLQSSRVGVEAVRSRCSSPWLVAHAQRLLATSTRPWEQTNGVVRRPTHCRMYATTTSGTESTTSGTSTAKKSSTGKARATKPKTGTTQKRTTGKKKTGTRTAKKARASKATTKSSTKAKAKPKKKKPAVKAAPTKRKKKVLTDDEKRTLKLRELRKTMLKAPKGKPSTAWGVYLAETVHSTPGDSQTARFADASKQAAQGYRNLRPEELEHYNHVANQNAQANEAVRRQWLQQFTPDQIREANHARRYLARLGSGGGASGGKARRFTGRIEDDRQVKKSLTSYSFFLRDRFASGDLKHLKMPEASRLVANEWRELSPHDKERYDAMAKADHQRYIQEYTSAYHHAPGERRPRATKATPAADAPAGEATAAAASG